MFLVHGQVPHILASVLGCGLQQVGFVPEMGKRYDHLILDLWQILLDPIGSLYIGNIVIDSSKPPPTKIAAHFQISGLLGKFRSVQVSSGKFR